MIIWFLSYFEVCCLFFKVKLLGRTNIFFRQVSFLNFFHPSSYRVRVHDNRRESKFFLYTSRNKLQTQFCSVKGWAWKRKSRNWMDWNVKQISFILHCHGGPIFPQPCPSIGTKLSGSSNLRIQCGHIIWVKCLALPKYIWLAILPGAIFWFRESKVLHFLKAVFYWYLKYQYQF